MTIDVGTVSPALSRVRALIAASYPGPPRAMALAVGVATAPALAVILGAVWACNAGLKSASASGLMLGFGLIPAYAASMLPDLAPGVNGLSRQAAVDAST